jgi:hypothetical protein
MKKVFLLATVALLMSSTVALANDGGKNKNKGKARTEKKCPTPCPKPCPPCCDKNKCEKS